MSACRAGQREVVMWLVNGGHSDPRTERNKVRLCDAIACVHC